MHRYGTAESRAILSDSQMEKTEINLKIIKNATLGASSLLSSMVKKWMEELKRERIRTKTHHAQ